MTILNQTDVARRLDAVERSGTAALGPDESLRSACDVGSIALLYPKQQPPWILTRFGLVGYSIHRMLEMRRAQRRKATLLQSIAYTAGGAVTELPEAARGCVLVLTSHRVLVYDRKVRTKLTECPRMGLAVSSNEHGLGRTSVVLSNGTERFAVAVTASKTAMCRDFLAACTTVSPSNIVTF